MGKKIIFLKSILAAMAVCLFSSCGNDNETINEDKNYIQIQYSFSASKDFLNYYHIISSYFDITGQQHTDTITNEGWEYVAGPSNLDEAPNKFMCKISAVRKEGYPQLTEYAYTLSYEQEVSVTVSNSHEREDKIFDGTPMKAWSWQASNASMKDFLESYPEIVLTDFILEKSSVFNK